MGNLSLAQVAAGQDQKEVTINDATDKLDIAMTESLSSDYTSGNVTLTLAQYREAMSFISTNLAVARTLTLSLVQRPAIVDNTAGTAILSVVQGSTTVVVEAGEIVHIYTDGTANGLVVTSRGTGGAAGAAAPNLIVNGGFQVAQNGVSFTLATTPDNSDDTYQLDQWKFLAEGADAADVTQETSSVPDGAQAAVKFLVATINLKFGYFQVLETRDAEALIGRTASLTFKARSTTGAVIRNIRVGILSWTSTADAPTSDPVSAWNAEGVDPTLVANWVYENTPADISVNLDTYVQHTVAGVAINAASAANVAVFIWVDDDDGAVNDELFIADVRVVAGDTPSAMIHEPFELALTRAQRFFQKSFELATAPAQNAGLPGAITYRAHTAGIENDGQYVAFDTRMRIAPTVTFYNPSAANALWRNATGVADSGAASADAEGERGFYATNVQVGGDLLGELFHVHYSATARL